MHFKTRLPLNLYIFILLTVSFVSYLLIEGMAIWSALIYSLPICFLYMAIANSAKDCQVELDGTHVQITYCASFWKRQKINVNDIERLEFRKGESSWKFFFLYDRYERNYRARDKLVLISSGAEKEF
jgi:hypothetical protein